MLLLLLILDLQAIVVYPLKFFDDFKLKVASKHPFLNQAIHFIFLNSFRNPIIGSFSSLIEECPLKNP
jgi:hypothetical protein